MKLLVFGEPQAYTDKHNLERLLKALEKSGRQVERIDILTREGVARMATYGVMTTPAFVVINDDGVAVSDWQYSQPNYEELSHAFGVFA